MALVVVELIEERLAILEEALATIPPANVARLETSAVPVIVVLPAEKAPATVEEAEEMNPPAVVSMPVVEALERVVTPVTLRVEESVVPPSTAKVP